MTDSPLISFPDGLEAELQNALSEDYSPETVFWKIHPDGRVFLGPSLAFYCSWDTFLNCLRAKFSRASFAIEVEFSSGQTFQSFEISVDSPIQALRVVEILRKCPGLELFPMPFA